MAERNQINNSVVHYREAAETDILLMADMRAVEWGDYNAWYERIKSYHDKNHHPQQALAPRIFYAAYQENKMIGFIAGHLTKRFGCQGELQWINVAPEYRNKGVAAALVKLLAAWFAAQNASRICVDPGNESARLFYKKQNAENLNEHWMYWKDISILLQEK